MLSRRLLRVVALLISFHILLAYGLPPLLLVAITVALAVWYRRLQWQAALSVSLSLLVATLLYALALRFTPLGDAWYYRPHEVLARWDYERGFRRYRANASFEMHMRHGDLQNLTHRDIARPRHVRFHTDALGWRNAPGSLDQYTAGGMDHWVLVGDSFVAGLGSDQDDLVERWLWRNHGIAAYNLGYTGDPADFAIRVDSFRRETGSRAPLILLLFEGNDFPDHLETPAMRKPSRFALFWKRYYRLFYETRVYRFTNSLIQRLSQRTSLKASSRVVFDTLGQEPVAFYAPYDAAARDGTYAPKASVETVIAGLAEEAVLVAFIPTKTRVYAQLIADRPELPNARWRWLEEVCARRQWSCLNLTPALVESGREAHVWWPDDTHWNARGMRVAASEIAAHLQGLQSAE